LFKTHNQYNDASSMKGRKKKSAVSASGSRV